MSPDLWQRGCEQLATEMPEQQFNTWIRPLMAGSATEQGLLDEAEAAVVSVRVANRFKLDWIRAQYAGRIEAVLTELAGKPVRLDLSVLPRSEAPTPSPAKALRRSSGVAAATLAVQALQRPPEAHQPV
ncbi:MAG TPA: DnaA N-terminal domain-containing protein, partial [Rubrivivax sp.]|nr:DnaA N-terminal domain-containing protein [Rubrivivax sp.]